MKHFFSHLHTVNKHRFTVMRHCFKVGLYWRGLVHDLSKYSPSEFWPGVKYYQGTRSPQAREREVLGYSAAWLHHKGRNKHHYEYWTDFGDGRRVYVDMPAKYFAEMVCDRVAACKIYLKKNYTDSSALEYFNEKTSPDAMCEATYERLKYFLTLLADEGEKRMFSELKAYLKKDKEDRKAEKRAEKRARKEEKKEAKKASK